MSLLRKIHLWLGLLIALPVATQGLTGAILAFEPLLPEVSAGSAGPSQPVNAIVAAARADRPAATLQRFTAPAAPGAAAHVLFSQDGGPVTVRVDPASLVVLGTEGPGAWAWLRTLHVSFLAADYGGRGIGGWFGIGLVLVLATGIPIWWPARGGWRDALTFAPKARGVRFHRRLHGAVGAWTVLALLVLAATGVVLAFPRTSRGLLGLEAGGPPRPARAPASAAAAPTPDLDAAIALARSAVPTATTRVVMVPARPNDALRIMMTHAGGEGATGSVVVQVDPAAGKVLAVQDARTAPPADRLYRWIHDLHEGMGLGPAWRILTVLAGLALPLFAVTGPLMWWLKRRNRIRMALAKQQAASPLPSPTGTHHA